MMDEIKRYTGISFVIASIILLAVLIILPINQYFIHIDEYYTLGLIKVPLIDGIKLTAMNVHPPLYYIILKIITSALTAIKVGYNTLFVAKMVSVIPYVILSVVGLTKIRKEYGWLTAGLFLFCVLAMSELYIFYVIARMYSWALLFIVMSFIYLKDVLVKSDLKSWTCLTVFAVLGAYTHYFVAISTIIMYLLLLSYICLNKLNNKKEKLREIKKWLISSFCGIILYLPWVQTLLNQMKAVHANYWIKAPTLYDIVNYFSYSSSVSENNAIKVFSILVLIFFCALAITKYKESSKLKNKIDRITNIENSYIFIGIGVFLLTIIIGVIISLTYKPVFIKRYLLPSLGLIWLSFSILIPKITNRKFFAISIILIISLAGFSMADNLNTQPGEYNQIMNEMNHNDTIVIICDAMNFLKFENSLNNTEIYTIDPGLGEDWDKILNKYHTYNKIKSDNINKILKNNTNKDIYLIEKEGDNILPKNTKTEKIGTISSRLYAYKIITN